MKLQISQKKSLNIALQLPQKEKVLFWWYQKGKLFFVGLFLIVSVVAGFFWYQYLYAYHWTEAERLEYRNQQSQGVSFQEDTFRQVVNLSEQRVQDHQSIYVVPIDIFTDTSTGQTQQ